jgi:transcriptional regulator with XRE-family HTH domain
MSDAFAAVLRARMARYYIADIDLARELGVSPATIARWSTGQSRPAREDLAVLSRILGLSRPKLEAILGSTHSLERGGQLDPEDVERTARDNWDELRQLPYPFRAPVLLAQVAANTTGIRELTD